MTDKRLLDRVAVITGAGDGIGKGIARRFAQEGARVVIAEIDGETGPMVAQELQDDFGVEAFYLHTDATKEEDNRRAVKEAVARWGTVDILVNNAWGGDRAGLQRVDKMPDDECDGSVLGDERSVPAYARAR
jgi:NAD(P)-dependent dehydrogenase (short-subunit alcohol dehydrogenase family)